MCHRSSCGRSKSSLLRDEHEAAPLFTGYVAASPSLFWDAGQVLEATAFERLTIGLRQYERVDHLGSVTPSFRDGLEFLFSHGFGAAP